MSMIHDAVLFEDDDDGYLTWSRQHPNGFVVNAVRGSLADPVLHRAGCVAITAHTGEGARWTRDDVKVCAEATGPLLMWGYQIHGTAPSECPRCDPTGQPPMAATPRGKTKTVTATPDAVRAWLARLREHGEADARVAEKVIDWSAERGLAPAFTGPPGKAATGTFVPLITESRPIVAPFGIKAGDRRVYLGGATLRAAPPFSSEVTYSEMVDRVLSIPGMVPTKRSPYPSIALAELDDDTTWSRFTDVFGTIVDEVRAARSRT